jgi:dATP pyrophosphohydrolase
MAHKIPISVLVVVHTPHLQVLLLERANAPGFWQSVTGSQEPGETLLQTAVRELKEETGLEVAPETLADWDKHNVFEIFQRWRSRYEPGVTHNTEHVFGLEVPEATPVVLDALEHVAYRWVPWQEAAQEVFSWTNADAIRELPLRSRGKVAEK